MLLYELSSLSNVYIAKIVIPVPSVVNICCPSESDCPKNKLVIPLRVPRSNAPKLLDKKAVNLDTSVDLNVGALNSSSPGSI